MHSFSEPNSSPAKDIFEDTFDLPPSDLLPELQTLIRQPSISSTGKGLEECANLIAKVMLKNGINSQLLYLDNIRAPLIFGERKSKKYPNGRTLLFYNHYDVQPVEPYDQWREHPFSGTIKGNRIFGRGSADDKGELMTRICAVSKIIETTGDVPCNIKFLVEGEEEIGSPNLNKYLKKYSQNFKCEGIIWEFGQVDSKGRPIINLGMKGMLYVELSVLRISTDLHSSLAAIVKSPAWRLLNALNTIWDDNTGTITIQGWHDDVIGFTKDEVLFMLQQPHFDEDEFKRKYCVDAFINDYKGDQIKQALAGNPTCNLSGILSGHTKEGAKTVLPNYAKARLDFRLVPNMDPLKQLNLLRDHFLRQGFSDVRISYVHGVAAARISFLDSLVEIVKRSAQKAFNRKPIINLSSAGSGPMSVLISWLHAPCVAAGCSSLYSNIHSYNEFAEISLLTIGTNFIAEIIKNFAARA